MPIIPRPTPSPWLQQAQQFIPQPVRGYLEETGRDPSSFVTPLGAVVKGAGPVGIRLAEYFARRYPKLWASINNVVFEPGQTVRGGELDAIRGRFFPESRDITVAEGLPISNVLETLAHELRHARQFKNVANPVPAHRGSRELQAERAAQSVSRKVLKRYIEVLTGER